MKKQGQKPSCIFLLEHVYAFLIVSKFLQTQRKPTVTGQEKYELPIQKLLQHSRNKIVQYSGKF